MADVAVNHNYGAPNALAYVAPNGQPIEAATIRIWKEPDYTGVYPLPPPIGTTTTDAYGQWVDAIVLEVGFSYVVQFHRPGIFGPDHKTIVV